MIASRRIPLSVWLLGALALAPVLADAGADAGEAVPVPPIANMPGAEAFPDALRAGLAAGLRARGADYVPRTHHLREDGSPEYTNRLILATSPYLLQHAHNPVNWYPWSDEAFEDARRLNRPVLLSIGYSTCHWCHVMEEESFEDLEIAEYLNANYIAIKVDREERPDIDSIYMAAVTMMVGRGGWPMTTWLTPDRRPFYGGTYFPARDGDRGTRTGFLTLLKKLRADYAAHPDKVAERASEIAQRIEQMMRPTSGIGTAIPAEASLDAAIESYRGSFDRVHGGRGRAPKFPSSLPNRLLLRHWLRTGDADLLEMATLTLSKMAQGGMYDQIGGGFHRYSTDARWLVPHFEKMLYDNALLAVAYLEGFQATGDEEFRRVATEILDYVGREMTGPEGGFYSATDADSRNAEGEMEEGWFFTWTPAELVRVLGRESAGRVGAYYGVTQKGNYEGRNILHVSRSVEQTAQELEIEPDALRGTLADSRRRLYDARQQRPRPLLDDKILTSWNGLMISAMARGGFVLGREEFTGRAAAAATFALQSMRREGRLLRSFSQGRANHNGYLDDYAFLIAGLLDLFETTFEPRWLASAVELQDVLDRHYADEVHGGYFATSDDHEALIAREKPVNDGAEPSGNAVALMNLLRLYELTTNDRYRLTADRLVAGLSTPLRQSPQGMSEMLLGLDFKLSRPKEIVLVHPPRGADAEAFLAVVRRTFLPGKVLVVVAEGQASERMSKLVPLVQGKVARKGKPTAYVCEQGVCQLPTSNVDVFTRQLVTSLATDSSAE